MASIAQTVGKLSGARFEDYVADAVAWLRQLTGDARFNGVTCWGTAKAR